MARDRKRRRAEDESNESQETTECQQSFCVDSSAGTPDYSSQSSDGVRSKKKHTKFLELVDGDTSSTLNQGDAGDDATKSLPIPQFSSIQDIYDYALDPSRCTGLVGQAMPLVLRFATRNGFVDTIKFLQYLPKFASGFSLSQLARILFIPSNVLLNDNCKPFLMLSPQEQERMRQQMSQTSNLTLKQFYSLRCLREIQLQIVFRLLCFKEQKQNNQQLGSASNCRDPLSKKRIDMLVTLLSYAKEAFIDTDVEIDGLNQDAKRLAEAQGASLADQRFEVYMRQTLVDCPIVSSNFPKTIALCYRIVMNWAPENIDKNFEKVLESIRSAQQRNEQEQCEGTGSTLMSPVSPLSGEHVPRDLDASVISSASQQSQEEFRTPRKRQRTTQLTPAAARSAPPLVRAFACSQEESPQSTGAVALDKTPLAMIMACRSVLQQAFNRKHLGFINPDLKPKTPIFMRQASISTAPKQTPKKFGHGELEVLDLPGYEEQPKLATPADSSKSSGRSKIGFEPLATGLKRHSATVKGVAKKSSLRLQNESLISSGCVTRLL